ncbi:MAG: TetR/AcrR family transcriptional regulator [Verrucomicrobiota bacterium]
MTTANSSSPSFSTEGRTAEVYRAAAELMVRKGFGGTSIADIAKAVGMTKAGLYHHISSKQDMLYQLIQHALDVLEKVVIEPTRQLEDPEIRLREIIRLHIGGILEHGLAFTILFSEAHHLDTIHREIITKRVNDYRAFIRKALEELAEKGKLRDLDVDIATMHLIQTITGVARWYGRSAVESEERLIEQTIDYNLSAILARSTE